jgi:hypothetical protein
MAYAGHAEDRKAILFRDNCLHPSLHRVVKSLRLPPSPTLATKLPVASQGKGESILQALQAANLPFWAIFLYDSGRPRPVIAVRFTCEPNARAEET